MSTAIYYFESDSDSQNSDGDKTIDKKLTTLSQDNKILMTTIGTDTKVNDGFSTPVCTGKSALSIMDETIFQYEYEYDLFDSSHLIESDDWEENYEYWKLNGLILSLYSLLSLSTCNYYYTFND
jgi:hypothetical protein